MRASAIAISVLLALSVATRARAQTDDDAVELLVTEAKSALARGDYGAAARKLDRAIAENPRRIDAYVLRASVYAVTKEFDAGVALMRRARALAPDNPEVLTSLGTQLVLAGKTDEGIPLLEGVVARFPARYQAHAALGHHYSANRQWKQAIASLEAYLSTRPPELSGEDAKHRLDLAYARLRSGEPPEARRIYREILTADPNDRRAKLGLVWATSAIDCREAAPLFAEVAALADEVPEVWLVEGRCALRTGKHRDALTLARRYRGVRRDSAGALALEGEALAASGDLAGARAALEKAAGAEPDNVLHVLRLARVERQAGEPAAAIARLEPLEVGAADRRDHVIELGEAYLAAGRGADAVAILTPWTAERPDDAQAATVLGEALLWGTRDVDAAIPMLRRGTGARARRLLEEAINVKAVALIGAGDAAGAEAVLESLPGASHPLTLQNRAVAALAQGKAARALEALQKAEGTIPDLLRARAHAKAGELEPARGLLDRTIRAADTPGDLLADAAHTLAAIEMEAGEPARAAAALELGLATLAKRKLPVDTSVQDAYVVAARAAGTKHLRAGAYAAAQRVLEEAEKLASGDALTAIRCELALAATAAGDGGAAEARLRALEKAKATCPFPAPADVLAAPILRALGGGNATRALDALEKFERKATGPAARLLADARRWLGLRAAAEAYASGKVDRTKGLLADVRKLKGAPTPELTLGLAVLDLEAGKLDAAIAAFERLVGEVPEARVHLGIAWERKGDPRRALAEFEKAAESGVRFAPLSGWIEAKRRLFGEVEP